MARPLRADERFAPEFLIQARAYALVQERRGDPGAAATLQLIESTGRLDPAQEMDARQRAEALYAEFTRRRQALGFPPFADGLPDDVRALAQRLLERSVAVTVEAVRTHQPVPPLAGIR